MDNQLLEGLDEETVAKVLWGAWQAFGQDNTTLAIPLEQLNRTWDELIEPERNLLRYFASAMIGHFGQAFAEVGRQFQTIYDVQIVEHMSAIAAYEAGEVSEGAPDIRASQLALVVLKAQAGTVSEMRSFIQRALDAAQ